MNASLDFTQTLAPPLPLLRFSVAQYHRLGELGLLQPENRVELLEGWIVENTSLERDRAKAAIYCSAGVEEYWIVNINEPSLERFQFAHANSPTFYRSDDSISLRIDEVDRSLELKRLFEI